VNNKGAATMDNIYKLNELIVLAGIHIDNGKNKSSANLALNSALLAREDGNIEEAYQWVIKSLCYSVGVFYPDCKKFDRGSKMDVIEAIEYFVSRTDGCFNDRLALDVSDCLKRVADLNLIQYDKANESNINFIFKEAFHFLKYDIEFIKFAYAVFENAAQWVREQKGE
jgi:hypothetical protein